MKHQRLTLIVMLLSLAIGILPTLAQNEEGYVAEYNCYVNPEPLTDAEGAEKDTLLTSIYIMTILEYDTSLAQARLRELGQQPDCVVIIEDAIFNNNIRYAKAVLDRVIASGDPRIQHFHLLAVLQFWNADGPEQAFDTIIEHDLLDGTEIDSPEIWMLLKLAYYSPETVPFLLWRMDESELSTSDLALFYSTMAQLTDGEEALVYLDQYYNLTGEERDSRYALLLFGAGRHEEAFELMNQIIQNSESVEDKIFALQMQASLYGMSGEVEVSNTFAQEAAELVLNEGDDNLFTQQSVFVGTFLGWEVATERWLQILEQPQAVHVVNRYGIFIGTVDGEYRDEMIQAGLFSLYLNLAEQFVTVDINGDGIVPAS